MLNNYTIIPGHPEIKLFSDTEFCQFNNIVFINIQFYVLLILLCTQKSTINKKTIFSY